MFWENKPQSDARERDGRKDSGHQKEGDKARKNQEEEIVAGVQRGQRDNDEPTEIDPALEGDPELRAVTDPAQWGALRQDGNQRHTYPAGDEQRGDCRSGGQGDLAEFGGGAGIQRQQECGGERGYGE